MQKDLATKRKFSVWKSPEHFLQSDHYNFDNDNRNKLYINLQCETYI